MNKKVYDPTWETLTIEPRANYLLPNEKSQDYDTAFPFFSFSKDDVLRLNIFTGP